MIWLLHKLGLVYGVWLQDYQGQVYRTWARKSPFGPRFAHVYPFMLVGHVTLNEDGTCSGDSCYIKRWLPMK